MGHQEGVQPVPWNGRCALVSGLELGEVLRWCDTTDDAVRAVGSRANWRTIPGCTRHTADASRRLEQRGLRVERVVLEEALKREYQRFLQEPNRGRRESSGRPGRSAEEIAGWAHYHDLPMVDDHGQFMYLRIECELEDGGREIEDVEVMTPHYRGAHTAGTKPSWLLR